MQKTARYDLPYLAAHQSQKHITHNEALAQIDVLLQASVVSRSLHEPPATLSDGDVFLVADEADADWAGADGHLAAWVDGVWQFKAPRRGCRIWVASEKLMTVYDGAEWVDIWSPSVVHTGAIGVNAEADSSNRLAVKSDAVLFSHDDVSPGSGDIRLQLNRLDETGTAAVLFATEYNASIELGLHGQNQFSLKATPDGQVFNELLTADAEEGRLNFPRGATFEDAFEFTPQVHQDGAPIMTLNIERAWQFEQFGSGANTHLGLRCLSSGKSLLILNRERTRQIELSPQTEEIKISGHPVLHRGELDPAALKTGGYDYAELPSASTAGAGSIVFVQDATLPALAYSDGTDWRWISDGTQV
jgi:hypothetical protein